MSANPENKLLKNSTVVSINATLQSILTALTTQNSKLDTQNANIAAWAGTLSQLTTGEKTSLVGAINWLKTQHDDKATTLTEHINTSAMHDVYDYLDSVSTPENGAMIHNSLARGKFLGSNLSEELYNNIAAGTFKGLWAGDYVTFTDVAYTYNSTAYTYSGDWLWGDCNYRIRIGNSTKVTRNHGAMLPREMLFNARMNPTNTTENGYVGCEMYTEHLKRAEAIVKACFGEEHVVPYYPIFVNAVANGKPSGYVYPGPRYIDLMNEPMVYGHYNFSSGGSDGITISDMDKSQLAIFKHDHSLEHRNSASYWLRDVVSGASFADVDSYGFAYSYNASRSMGVRPAALIG